MITDRYAPVDLFALVPTLTREMDPELAALDQLVDDAMLIAEVKAAMSTRAPHSADRGTSSTPVEVVLRLLLVRRLYHWSYRQTAWFVDDSLSLRHFCRLYDQKAPDHSTLVRWAGVLGTTTIKALHERVVDLAIERGVTRGRKLRIDGTAVESTIHPPSDSSLLADAGRMLSRVLRRAQAVVGEGTPASLFRDWTRSTKRLARQISEAARKRSEDGKRLRATTYRRLLGIIGTVQRQAVQVGALLGDAGAAGDRLHHHLGTLLPVVEQVVQQTTRRLAGEQVPADEKIVSLTEPHTDIIQRGKPRQQMSSGIRSFWTRSKAGSSATTRCWMGTRQSPGRCAGRWSGIGSGSGGHRTWWRPIAAFTRRGMRTQ